MWRNKVLPLTYVQCFSCPSLLRREPSPPHIPQVDRRRARCRRQLKPACVISDALSFYSTWNHSLSPCAGWSSLDQNGYKKVTLFLESCPGTFTALATAYSFDAFAFLDPEIYDWAVPYYLIAEVFVLQ